MIKNPNREIYNTKYKSNQLIFRPRNSYDEYVISMRLNFLRRHSAGKDVLDLCCGSGTYALQILDLVKTIVGLDFSRNLLESFKSQLRDLQLKSKVKIVEGDAKALPFVCNSFDTVFSYTSLYYIPDIKDSIFEVSRVLRPGGVAILEFGNLYSLATITSKVCNLCCNWAKPYHISYFKMKKIIDDAGLEVKEHYALQLLPMFGTKSVQLLLPFSLSLFKYPMSIKFRGRILDVMISSTPFFRLFAFRHIFVVSKK